MLLHSHPLGSRSPFMRQTAVPRGQRKLSLNIPICGKLRYGWRHAGLLTGGGEGREGDARECCLTFPAVMSTQRKHWWQRPHHPSSALKMTRGEGGLRGTCHLASLKLHFTGQVQASRPGRRGRGRANQPPTTPSPHALVSMSPLLPHRTPAIVDTHDERE